MSKVCYSQAYVDALRVRLLFIIYLLSAKIKRTIDYTNAHIETVEKDANEQLQARITEVSLLVETLEGNGNLIWNELKTAEAELGRLASENKRLQKRVEVLEAKVKRRIKHGKSMREDFEG